MDNKLVPKEVSQYLNSAGSVSPILLAEQLGEPLHEGQKEIALNFDRNKREEWFYLSVLNSRRWGKTHLAKYLVASELLTPYAQVGVITHSTTLSFSYFDDVLRILSKIPNLELKTDRKAQKIMIPQIKSKLIIMSQNTYETYGIGVSLSILFLDEQGLYSKDNQVNSLNLLLPTMTNYGSNSKGIKNGKVVSMTTPRGYQMGSEQGRRHYLATSGERGYKAYSFDIYTSPFVTEADIEEIKRTTPESIFEQEFLVKYSNGASSIMRNWDVSSQVVDWDINRIKQFAGNNFQLILGMDFGQNDGASTSIFIHNNITGKTLQVDDWYEKMKLSREHLVATFEMEDKWKALLDIPDANVIRFGDSSNLEIRLQSQRDFNRVINKAYKSREKNFDFLNTLCDKKADGGDADLLVLASCKESIRHYSYGEFKMIGDEPTLNFAKDPVKASHWELIHSCIYALHSYHKMSHSSFIVT